MPQMRPIASRSRYFILLDRGVPIFLLCTLDNINSETRANSSKPAWRKVSKISILKLHCALLKLPRSRLNLRVIYLGNRCSQRFADCFSRQVRVFSSPWIFRSMDLSEDLDWVTIFWSFAFECVVYDAFKYGAALKGLRVALHLSGTFQRVKNRILDFDPIFASRPSG